jgi:2'-5' RNA ligase
VINNEKGRSRKGKKMKRIPQETIRTFIAVELPREIHDRLQQLRDDLGTSMPDVRWTKHGNIHLTLKFLGDVEVSRIDKISDSLMDVARQFPPFAVSLAGIGAFPNSRKPRIVWVGVKKGADRLVEIARSIEASMKRLGFPRERRPFRPHLTVGRIRRLKNPQAMTRALDESEVGDLGEFAVGKISLIRSQLDPAGSIYTTIAEAPLQGVEGNIT